MSNKRKQGGGDRKGGSSKKRPWRPEANLSGHGVFMTCVRGKERRAANELIDVLKDTARTMYPDLDLDNLPPVEKRKPAVEETVNNEDDFDAVANKSRSPKSPAAEIEKESTPPPAVAAPENDIEAELRAELAGMKKAKSHGSKQRNGGQEKSKTPTTPIVSAFRYIETGTECLTWISFHPQMDPFDVCHEFLSQVEKTGEARSRYVSRLSPVAGFENASVTGLESLCSKFTPKFFPPAGSGTFKIDPRIRSHNILKRDEVISIAGSYITRTAEGGPGYVADLKNPTHWLTIEVHKSQAAFGVTKDYLRFCRWNPVELANSVKAKSVTADGGVTEGRVGNKPIANQGTEVTPNAS